MLCSAMGSPLDVRADSALVGVLRRHWAVIEPSAPDLVRSELISLLRADEARLRVEGRWVAGPTSLIEVLGLERDEVRNCRVVRWVLDPLAPHGLGGDALRLVLERVNQLATEQGVEPQDFPRADDATVTVEEARGNTRADIVITGPTWMVVVEAKIGAGEQFEQGRRLSELWPDATYVYLTRRGSGMATAGEAEWIKMRWADLLGAVRQAAAESWSDPPASPEVDRARRAVLDYLHGARRLTR